MEEFALRLRLGGYFGIFDLGFEFKFKNTPQAPITPFVYLLWSR